jgi:pimeloyl-ACP methyl ester carboxylesterase
MLSHAVNDGVRIHYEIVGSGPPLILQHGFTQSAKDWYRAGYVDALKPHYQLILVDARGHGESDKPHDAAAYTLSNRVNDIVAVMNSIGILRADYWGYSMGGWIGFGMAMQAQARLRTIIIGGQDPFGRKMPPGHPGWKRRQGIHHIVSQAYRNGLRCTARRRQGATTCQ